MLEYFLLGLVALIVIRFFFKKSASGEKIVATGRGSDGQKITVVESKKSKNRGRKFVE